MGVLKLGIDDAGRGPVIGPMVLAGCLIDDKIEEEFRKFRVRDSKQLTSRRREFLAEFIKEKAKIFEIVLLHPEDIDKRNGEGIKLNELEALAAAEIINKLNTEQYTKGEKIRVILDCPSTSIQKWSDFLKMHIKNLSNLEIVCEHKADKNHIAVSAASILAKSKREAEVAKLKEEFGHDIGSGYSSDPITRKFLAKNAKNHKHKKIFRKTWKTWKKANSDLEQKKLGI